MFDIDYNLNDGQSLEDAYHNVDELKKFNMPRKNLTAKEVKEIINQIPTDIRYQFKLIEWDNDNRDMYGIPELIQTINLDEAVL